ncbi:hypothetical protein ACJZ2D_005208 [Fusarium nematophilum]
MDLEDSRQRSASQTSLLSTYRAHEKQSTFSMPRPPSRQRLPYQSLNETSALLRSPGPLESMLKTTTETGDIGIFSIKPPVPSVTFHHPPRPRPDIRGHMRPPRSCFRSTEDGPVHDDRKSLPSYRDTTSEIISLYGSSTQSYSRSFSPSLDDGQRSYSLTTCSSRRIPSRKSSGTLQSLPSNGGLQRPRSPFPYPTRLKRPGVRPTSPAMTENGVVDYSRMVEIDRATHRTVHGLYQLAGRRSHRRHPPLSLRPEFSRSTSSLPSRASPVPYHYGTGPHRSRTPNSLPYWNPRPQFRQPSSSDQSIRSSSLTSIVEMYQRMQPSIAAPSLRATGSFYYDYSEEFDTETQYDLEYAVPLYPFPRRTEEINRPTVSGGDADPTNGADVLPSRESALDNVKDPTALPLGEESQHRTDRDKTTQATTEPCQSSSGDVSLSRNASERSHGTPNSFEALKTPSNCEMTGYPSRSGAFRRSKTVGAEPETSPRERMPRFSQTPEDYVLDSTLTERGSPVPPPGRGCIVPPVDERGIPEATSAFHEVQGTCQQRDSRLPTHPHPRKRSAQLQGAGLATKAKSHRRYHRRNPAATNIIAPHDSEQAISQPKLQQGNADTPILSPNPISPAHQLRVTNSIPQLMKALPPLPDDAQQAVESPHGSSSTEAEVSTRLLFASPALDAVPAEPEPNASLLALKSFSCDDNTESSSREGLQSTPSRFKVRLRSSRSTGFHSKQGLGPGAVPTRSSSNPLKPRLRIKVSRSKLSQKPLVQEGTVVRNAGLRQYNSLLELKNFPQRDLFTNRSSFGEALEEQLAQLGVEGKRLSNIDESANRNQSPRLSDQFDISYPPSPRGIEAAMPASQPVLESEPGGSKRRPRLDQARNRRVLVRKISFLPPRAISTSKVRKQRRISPTHGSDPTPRRSRPSRTSSFDESGIVPSPTGQTLVRSHNKGKRVRRWASEAKRAVRSYVRRTLNRTWH